MDKIDYCLKYILIGDSNTGKSCFLRQFLDKKFPEDQTHTIGVEFGAKIIQNSEKNIKLQIWDTAGQERYRSVTRSYYRGASAALIFYDVTNRESFKHVSQWLDDAKQLGGNQVICALVGHKKDRDEERRVTFLEGTMFAKDNNLLFFEASAFTGEGIDECISKITKTIVYKLKEEQAALQQQIDEQSISVSRKQLNRDDYMKEGNQGSKCAC